MRENGRGVVREHSVQAGLQRNEGLREKSMSAQFLVLNYYQRPKTTCIGHCFKCIYSAQLACLPKFPLPLLTQCALVLQ